MRLALLACLPLLLAAPALADVRTGVDAWGRGDYRKAVDEWREPAVAGDADAQFNLGQAYKLGRGVPLDPQMAESWFGKAARQGHPQAEDNYALALFQSGRRNEALPWLAKSTARDEPRTELVLGTMLFNGDGVPRDYVRAYALMTRAAAPRPPSNGNPATDGLASARETLAQMDGYVSASDREQGLAMAQQIALTASTQPPSRPGATRVTEAEPRPMRTTDLPPSRLGPDRAAPPRVVRITPVPPPRAAGPAPEAPPARTAPAAGGYRVQLGAFRDRANAEKLWARLAGKFGGGIQPSYVAAAGVTRLQATGFATRAAAQGACAKAGGGCIVVAP